jgi:hypothetical protein
MRAGYRVVADGGNGLTDLAGVDNFSGPRRCSGKGCAGDGTIGARSTRRPDVPHDNALCDAAMEATALRRRPRRPRQGRKGVRTRARAVRVVTTQTTTTRRSLAPVAARAREHQQHDSSNGISSHSTRNHRFNTVHATAPLMPPADDAVASPPPPPWWPPRVVLRAGRSECRTRRRRSRLSVVS